MKDSESVWEDGRNQATDMAREYETVPPTKVGNIPDHPHPLLPLSPIWQLRPVRDTYGLICKTGRHGIN